MSDNQVVAKCWRCWGIHDPAYTAYTTRLIQPEIPWCPTCWELVGSHGPDLDCAECGGDMGWAHPPQDRLQCFDCGRVVS